MAVDTPTKEYMECEKSWRRVMDVCKGARHIRDHDIESYNSVNFGDHDMRDPSELNSTYLTPFDVDMDAHVYRLFAQNIELPGVTKMVRDATVGVIKSGLKIDEGSHAEHLKHVGDDMSTFKEVAEKCIELDIPSRVGVFVDYNGDTTGMSVAMVNSNRSLGARMVVFDGPQILEASFGNIGGIKMLKRVRLGIKETYEDQDFEEKEREIIVVLRLEEVEGKGFYTYQKYVKDEETDDYQAQDLLIPKLNGVALDYIPFWVTEEECMESMLEDLVDLEIRSMNKITQANFAFMRANSPTIVGTGIDDDEAQVVARVGWGGFWAFRNEMASVEVTSLPTAVIENFTNMNQEARRNLAMHGANTLGQMGAQAESGVSQEWKNMAYVNRTKRKAERLEKILNNAVQLVIEWNTGVKPEDVAVTIEPDFDTAEQTVQELELLANLGEKGYARKEDIFNAQKKAGIIPDTLEYDTWVEELEANQTDTPLQFEDNPEENRSPIKKVLTLTPTG